MDFAQIGERPIGKPIERITVSMKWYQEALLQGYIDSWNFNCFLKPGKRYYLMCARTLEIAEGMELSQIRQGKDSLWYGLLKSFRG